MRPFIGIAAMGVSLALATACGSSEYGLVSPVASEDGASHEASGKRDNGVPSERSYSVSPDIEQADFLFVVDPSVSMLGVLKSMREGFRSLEDGGFSRNTQIAVMTTTPASADGSRPHFSVADVEGAMRQFEAEKVRYPESEQFIDGLLARISDPPPLAP